MGVGIGVLDLGFAFHKIVLPNFGIAIARARPSGICNICMYLHELLLTCCLPRA